MTKFYDKSTLIILSDVVAKPAHGYLAKISENNIEKHFLNFSKFSILCRTWNLRWIVGQKKEVMFI